jgi:guanylate kinase
MHGQLFVISAPSGAGKSTIIPAVRERFEDLRYSVSHTSRDPRPGEVDGVHYHFVDGNRFESMIEEGVFIEWARVYDAYYGTSVSDLEKSLSSGSDVLLDLDRQGALNIKIEYPKSILIYIVPPSLEVLEKRLRDRSTEGEGELRMRLEKAREEIQHFYRYDYVVVNDDLMKAVEEVQSIILSERCRTERMAPWIDRLFGFPSTDPRT